jgi:ABC-2 type transport system permease protein
MSASLTVDAGARVAAHETRPSFLGLLGGELFKVSRLRTIWVLTLLLVGIIAAPYLFYLATPGVKNGLLSAPLRTLLVATQRDLAVLRVFSGIYLLIVTAYVVGLEYQQGTIRIILARGVGRLQLLGAKVLALVAIALGVLVGGILLNAVLMCGLLLALVGNLNALQSVTPEFWTDTWLYVLTVAISMGVTLLLSLAASVIGRTLASGLGIGLSWFPADNIGAVMMTLVYRFTNNDFWLKITGYFLGPNLNAMPALVIPARVVTVQTPGGIEHVSQQAATVGFQPYTSIDGTHTLMVALVYALIFAAVAVVLTWRRDVLE